ncbi:potassium/sodium hyperpolarization-activated cyclic nucleotide-gated channel 1 [Asbolus verrucosus]|uniref:Potassium/sodium hyperpolarization-activated cyclic nucleotide-gated channel 1 n=1 Tax=Asbolus verrucosus TaxID=1661398 RepID=A0A482VFK3_ASBVE|nr:potassium/sodium hyperpolarization-activated cyclic nucleotide-gated channel 1 [Asbolus verrucosus]
MSGILPRRTSRRMSIMPRQKDVGPVVRKIPGHQCELTISDDQIHHVISNGIFVLLRRRFRKWLTVCPSSPESKMFLKSSAEIEREEMRHYRHYFYMIHPFSKGRFVWEMLMIPVFLMLFCLIPLEIASTIVSPLRLYWKFTLDVISYVDIILFFFTGYFDEHKQKVVMDPRSVAKRYVLRLFFFDVVSSFPITWYLQVANVPKEYDTYRMKLVLLLKLVRMPTLTRYLHKFSEHMNIWSNNIKFLNFILWVCVLVMWATCITYCITIIKSSITYKEWEEKYTRQDDDIISMVMTLYDVVRGFMKLGIGELQNMSDWKMIFEITALMFGNVLNIVILAKVTQIFQKQASSRKKYSSLIDEIDEYMKYKELPARVKEKVFHYLEFKFQQHIFREDEILNTVSSVLKQEILLHTCQTMIETVDFFKDLPTQVMLRLVTKLRSEIYLPNDIIVMAGYTGNAMYFIYTGTVAVYTSTGKEVLFLWGWNESKHFFSQICHLEDGGHFGEIALVYNEPRVATVVAVRECELFKLNRKDFQEAIEPFPELTKKIRVLAMSRMETTKSMTEGKVSSHTDTISLIYDIEHRFHDQ